MKLINIPIEPLEERYSIQWDQWFLYHFNEFFARDLITVYGEKTSGKIENGSFLDVIETNVYKTSQLNRVLKVLAQLPREEKVVLFFHDLWFPGLETIAYVKDGLGLDLKICGCLHAGAYDPFDFLTKKGMDRWAYDLENSWFGQIVDTIFVATEFHKKLLMEKRMVLSDKIKVTGFPLYFPTIESYVERKRMIVFPHRLDSEKQPEMFESMRKSISLDPGFSDIAWIKTKEIARTKEDYYNFLRMSVIALSFARQETWGIAMQEATLYGAIPLCPDRLSYSEMYLTDFLYEDLNDCWRKIRFYLSMEPKEYENTLKLQQQMIINAGSQAIPNIIKLIRFL